MASVRGMTPEAILALIKRELADVKLSEDQIRDLIQTNTDIVDSIVNLEDQVQAGLTGDALDQLNLDLQQLRSELQTQAAALAAADTTLQENAQTLIDNQVEMALLSVLLSDEGFLNTEAIKPGTIIGEHLAAQTVSALNIASGAIVSEKIAADAITANHILAESITGDRLVARTVGADRLVADSITANEISSRAITTNELAVGAVSAENISAEGISADLITAGSLSATRVELAGNDLATQMEFILSEMDRKFDGVVSRVDQLDRMIIDDLLTPAFHFLYGDLRIPDTPFYTQFATWINTSRDVQGTYGEPALIALRVEIHETLGVWTLRFSSSFEGRIQVYSGGQRIMEHIQNPSNNSLPFIELRETPPIERVTWYAESQVPYIYAWRQGYNVGGVQPRNPSGTYSYTDPRKADVFTVYTDAQNLNAIRSVILPPLEHQRTRGTAEGRSFLTSHYTSGAVEEIEYPTDAANPTSWFTPAFEVELSRPATAIAVNGTMHISQPRRSDRYGFAVLHNDTVIDYVVEGGVGTLTGASISFTHQGVSLYKTTKASFAAGDRVGLVPITLRNIPGPAVNALIMHWDVTVSALRY